MSAVSYGGGDPRLSLSVGSKGKMVVVGERVSWRRCWLPREFAWGERFVGQKTSSSISFALWVTPDCQTRVALQLLACGSLVHSSGVLFCPSQFFAPYWILACSVQHFFFFFFKGGRYHFSLCLCQILWFLQLRVCFLFKIRLPFKTAGRLTPVRLTAMRSALRSTSRSLPSFIFIYQRPLICFLYE